MNYVIHRAFWKNMGGPLALLIGGGALWFFAPSQLVFALGLITIGVGGVVAAWWQKHLQFSQLVASVEQLVRGEWKASDQMTSAPGNESVEALYHKLHEATEFIEALGATEAVAELNFVQPDEQLGKALLKMKLTLQEYQEQEETRRWSAQGLTHFSDILRDNTSSIEVFSEQVIRHLVIFLEMNQGGIFVKAEEKDRTWLDLTACYAYDKQRHIQKRYAPGQGLIGQCYLDQKTTLLTKVPDQYTTITSGMGEATPSVVVIVPLRWNDDTYGVVELAGFKELAPHRLSFLEKVAESIASSLSAVQTKVHMQQLLQTSQQLTQEYEQLSLVANNTDNSVIITDNVGRIKFVNQGFVRLTGYTAQDAIGNKPGHLLQGPDTNPETVKRIRQQLKEGSAFYEEILNYRKSGESYWISLTINPIRNEFGHVEQFVSIQADVTQIKQQTLDYTYKLEAISRSNAVIEFDPQGAIVDANDLYLDVSGHRKKDLLGKSYGYLLSESEQKSPQHQMMWDNLRAGTYFSGEFKQQSKQGEELWLSGTFNPIFDLRNNLQKILMFAQFTTYEKEKHHELTGMVQAFTDAVLSFDMTPEGRIKKANALFLKRFGYKRREISQKSIADLLVANTRLPNFDITLREQGSIRVPLTLLTHTGEEVASQCLFSGINNLENKLSKIVVVVLEDHR